MYDCCETFVIIILLLCSLMANQLFEITNINKLPEDAILDFKGLASKYGHPPLEYTVITEDGYILTLYRLPGRSLYPVFLMHGLYDSSDSYLIRGNKSLGISLANAGYDVWFGNSRGNRYSRKHVFMNPDSDERYWKFSVHQIGYYDLPAMIDIILKETKASTLTAIAHSQSTAAFFVLGSTRTEYNAKINIMMALAPICYIHNAGPPLSNAIELSSFLEESVSYLKINEFFGDNSTMRDMLLRICLQPITGYAICTTAIFEGSGYDPTELEPSFLPICMMHFPAGGSIMSALHFLQIGRTKIFARYDYGKEQNQILYNSSTPTAYDLRNVVMPVALFTARNDRLSTLPDVTLLRKQLPNVVYNIVNSRDLFNHVDYVWGRRMDQFLFPYIYEVLENYNGIDKNRTIS